MRLFFLILSLCAVSHAAPIDPARVAVIYNSSLPESAELARAYADARDIPEKNLIAIDTPAEDTVTREQYKELIEKPLRAHFTENTLWTLARQADGIILPIKKDIDILVTVRGIPFRISREAVEDAPDPAPQFHAANEAAVDSELAGLGLVSAPISGPLQNQYYEKKLPFSQAELPFLFLVGRLDGPSWEDCHRLYKDAIAVEKTGLWGLSYLDLSGRNPEGDKWIKNIASINAILGIPYVVDEHNPTFPAYYPMEQAALYYGWYTQERNGPLLNPDFRFKQGAIAMHLHSFSGSQLRHAEKKWAGPLIAHGAAVTVGNVYEPYLHMTHHFDLFHEALMEGRPVIEAAYSSIPVISWQGMVIGDPLYRPFIHFDSISGEMTNADKPFRVLRAAAGQWSRDQDTYTTKVRSAASKLSSGVLYESLGLRAGRVQDWAVAQAFFDAADKAYEGSPADQLRQNLHIVDLARRAKIIPQGVQRLKEMQVRFADLPESAAITSLLTLLDPPPPPPASQPQNGPKK